MNALTKSPPAPASPPLVAGAGAAGKVPCASPVAGNSASPLDVEPGLPHPLPHPAHPELVEGLPFYLFTQAWTDALTLRAAHHAHGHTPDRDDASGPCLIAERAMSRLIMAIDMLRGEPSTLPARLCPRTRAVTQRRLANAMALIAAAHDAISRLPDGV